jgi:DNA mismatch endonuclease (patch repair protein)
MSLIRGTGNQATELRMISFFQQHSISGWRRHQALPGRPDFIFPKKHVAVFVDGCFWHCCPKHCTLPITNRSFWQKKLEGNITHDKVINLALRKRGWRVLRVWQHELKRGNEGKLLARIRKVLAARTRVVARES